MHIVEFAIILIMCAISAALGVVISKRFPRLRRPLVIAGFLFIAINVFVDVWLGRLIAMYFQRFTSELVLACSFFLLGVMGVHYRMTLSQRILHDLFILILGFYVLAEPFGFALRADQLKSLDHKVKDGVTLQTTHFTCVPASLATILRQWGYEYTEGELAYELRSNSNGTHLGSIFSAVDKFGEERVLQAKIIKTDFSELRRLNVPVILSTYTGSISHASALLGLQEEKVIAGEPLTGLLRMPREKYQDRWRWTGVAVVIAPDFLHTFDARATHPRAVALLDKVQTLGYTRDKAGVSVIQQHQGLEVSGVLDWRTILVVDSLTGPPGRPRLTIYPQGSQV